MKATNSSYQILHRLILILSLANQSTSMASHNQYSDNSFSTHTDESIQVDHDESDLIFSHIAKEIVGTVNNYPGRKEG